MKQIIMTLPALLLTGCSEIAYRSGDGVDAVTKPGAYPAIRRDWRILFGREGAGVVPIIASAPPAPIKP